jgi:hypothetical protein
MTMTKLFDSYDAEDEEREPPTCNRCGATDLIWVETGRGWRLADDKGLHTCSRKPSLDAFEDLTK